jgi:hypothetical protein
VPGLLVTMLLMASDFRALVQVAVVLGSPVLADPTWWQYWCRNTDLLGVNELHPVDIGRWRRLWDCAGRMMSESDVKVAVLSCCTLNAPLR